MAKHRIFGWMEVSPKEKQRLREKGSVRIAPFQSVADLMRLCEETGVDPEKTGIYGGYHAASDNQGGIGLTQLTDEEDPVCQCWNEGQWGRVHREDCPIHKEDA